MSRKRRKKLTAAPKTRIWIERGLFKSIAWRDLKTAASCAVLSDFWCKRTMENQRIASKSDNWIITNNGEITYTYKEAFDKGMTSPKFTRALDDLIEHGFLDIARTGAGQFKVTTLYALSERWRMYGTPEFVEAHRPNRRRHNARTGFQPKAGHVVNP